MFDRITILQLMLSILFLLWGTTHLLVVAETSTAKVSGSAVGVASNDRTAILQWVTDLDSDNFELRERAQLKLTTTGTPALSEVSRIARSSTLESSTRAINILLTWSEGDNRQLALAALEQLASLKNRPTESGRAAEVLAEVRELAALEAIVSLGGSYQMNSQLAGVINVIPAVHYQVIIGSKWRGGVESLKLLQDIPHASIISFYSPPLEDEALVFLENLPHLVRVELYGTSFSEKAIEEMAQKLPHVKDIDVRQSAAFLGIRGDGGQNAHVVDVVPDSAAAKAGIQRDDIITHIEGQEVENFMALTALIAQYQPGEEVHLTIFRPKDNQEMQTLELTVKLAQWGPTSREALPELRKINLERR